MDLRSFVVTVTINGVLHFEIPLLNPNFQLQTFISLYRLLHHLTSSIAPVTLSTTTRGHLTIKPLVTSQILWQKKQAWSCLSCRAGPDQLLLRTW